MPKTLGIGLSASMYMANLGGGGPVLPPFIEDESGDVITGEDGEPIGPEGEYPTTDEPTAGDYTMIVEDPGTDPKTRKVKIDDLLTSANDVIHAVSLYSTYVSDFYQALTVPFDGEYFDVGDLHSGSSTAAYAQADGKYLLVATAHWSNFTGRDRSISFIVNGSEIATAKTYVGATGPAISLYTTVQLSEGDYVQLYAYESAVPNGHLVYASAYSTNLSMIRIG